MIDVDVRPPHKTLYEVLVVPPATSSRQIRRIARALRRNLPNLSDLDDVCLAEQVLGRRDLRTEYDALLARARDAKLTLPQIGPAIEGSRPAAPPPPPTSPAPFSSVGRPSDSSSGDAGKLLLRVAIAAVALIGVTVGKSSRHDTDHYRVPELRPIEIPRFDPRALDPHVLGLDRTDPVPLDPDRFAIPKLGPETDLDRAEELRRRIEALRHVAPTTLPPKRPGAAGTAGADRTPVETP